MNDLRGQVENVLQRVKYVKLGQSLEPLTDELMALIADAMLSLTKPTTYAEEIAAMSPETGGWRRQAMERDLAAIGITGAGQEGDGR